MDYIQAIVNACEDSLRASGRRCEGDSNWTDYVTHLVYLRECEISVDAAELKKKGIECVGVWQGKDGMVYESGVLERVLSGICLGRGGLQRRATVHNVPIS